MCDSVVEQNIGHLDAATGTQNSIHLAEHLRLVGTKIKHAIGNDDINALVGERDALLRDRLR